MGSRPISRPKQKKPDAETMTIERAILDRKVEMLGGGQILRIFLGENNHYDVHLTVEELDSLAQRTRIRGGKWLIYRSRAEIDDAWKL
jgi:hypothetical protein